MVQYSMVGDWVGVVYCNGCKASAGHAPQEYEKYSEQHSILLYCMFLSFWIVPVKPQQFPIAGGPTPVQSSLFHAHLRCSKRQGQKNRHRQRKRATFDVTILLFLYQFNSTHQFDTENKNIEQLPTICFINMNGLVFHSK